MGAELQEKREQSGASQNRSIAGKCFGVIDTFGEQQGGEWAPLT